MAAEEAAKPHPKKIEDESFARLCERERLNIVQVFRILISLQSSEWFLILITQQVPADGNCLFNAVVTAFGKTPGCK